jgi:nucleotide-binding universal stress UspA family protein
MNFLVNADDVSVELGLAFAHALHATVTVLESVDPKTSHDGAALPGENAVRHFRDAGIPADLVQREGEWLTTLVAATRAYRFDLAVVPEMRRRGLADWLLGRVPHSLLADVRTDLLIGRHARPGVTRLLMAVATGPGQKELLRWGGQVARAFNARPVLFHVTGRVPHMFDGLASVEEPLARFMRTNTPEARALQSSAASLRELDLEPELKLAQGSVGDEVVAEAGAGNYDLIVLGSTYAGAISVRWLMPRVTERVVNRAPCPVLVVRRGAFREMPLQDHE